MTSAESPTPYRVLARKYRPRNFDELIGQDALVRTLKNAIDSGRIAHAFMLTGVRGVGKTTTARIIARALNYTGPDGKAGPTTGPTDDCDICRAIAEDRHPDVMEMDAASRTGVDDIREILDGVRYAPVSARYKIYIIDEVHMLSKAAFNALLKTLEEPPSHVKFIFATTEIRKVPVTVLSRCQRFDLRRVDADVLATYFTSICEKEGVSSEPAAIEAIGRAADGSVRDGLSLLDQAIALGSGDVRTEDVTRMLGLSDRSITLSLYAAAMSGHVSEALALLERLHQAGADPLVSLQDLMEVAHDITLLKALEVRPEALKHTSLPHAEGDRALGLARDVPMPALQRSWSLLLKGLRDAQTAPDTKAAAEMAVMRLIYASELPDPARLIRDLQDGTSVVRGGGASDRPVGTSVHAPQMSRDLPGPVTLKAVAGGGTVIQAVAQAVAEINPAIIPQDFEAVVALCEDRGELLLASQLINYAYPVHFEVGRLEFRPGADAPANLAQKLSKSLQDWTGMRWMISVSSEVGEPTLAMRRNAAKTALREEVLANADVKAVQDVFAGAELHRIIDDKK